MEEELWYHRVYRSLSAPRYAVNFFVKLTQVEIALCLIIAYVLFLTIGTLHIGHYELFGLLRLDPWVWLLSAPVAAIIFTAAHRLRPDGQTEQIIRDVVAAKLMRARPIGGDQRWRPVDARRFSRQYQAATTNLSFNKRG